MTNQYILSLDGGTESARAALFTLDGRLIASHAEKYPLRHPNPGWAEQRPEEWWQSIVGAVRGTLQKTNVPKESIVSVGGDFTSCTVVLLDEDFNPVRPAVIWMDVRASEQARRIAGSGFEALKYNGYGNVSAEWMPCKALWLKENEPENWAKARYVGEYNDWFTQKMTGEWTGSIDNVSVRWYYDRHTGGFPQDFYEGIGLGDVLEKFPQRILDLGAVVGPLKADVADELGLPAGIPVGQGGVDAMIAMVGLGVVKPGKMAFITGSSHLHMGISAHQFHGKGIFGAYTDAIVPNTYLVEGGQISTGSVVRWFVENFGGGYKQRAAEAGTDVFALLTEEAEKLPVGSEGLIVLDYWQGNRTPLTDPDARGMMWGFTLAHTPAHVYRAIIEGIAYGTEHILRTQREHGYAVNELIATGGPTQSPFWMQIHADVSNVPITLTEAGDSAALLGSAICGAVAAGVYDSVESAVDAMVRTTDTIEPNPARHAEYQFFVDKYIGTYPQMKDLMHSVTRHVASQAK